MISGRSRLDFPVGEEQGIKVVGAVVPMEIFLAANVVDGAGEKMNRLVCRPKGTKQFYFLLPRGAEEAMKPVAGWLQELLERESASLSGAIPEDPVTDVPVGSPMEEKKNAKAATAR
jgi:hypothetical protein